MSSNEDDLTFEDGGRDDDQRFKKRRIHRACDICRRKKIKCDGVQMPGNQCSNCTACNFQCTYVEAAKKRGPPKGYVESLEMRLEQLDRLLRLVCPDEMFLDNNLDSESRSIGGIAPLQSSFRVASTSSTSSGLILSPKSPSDIVTSVIRNAGSSENELLQEDDLDPRSITNCLKNLAIRPSDHRFLGQSSGAALILTAIDIKSEYTRSWRDLKHYILGTKRPEFWTVRAWERAAFARRRSRYTFPDDDLLSDLVDIYFKEINLYLPLLHRPIFERSVQEGLHLTDEKFGAVVLLVCAMGSRWSNDPRVFLEGASSQSCGWTWFEQVRLVENFLLDPPSLHDVQAYCLAVQYLQGASAPHSCWTLVGVGIRLAQDVGAHRRAASNDQPLTPDDEQWKRAFWVLVCLDRTISASMGRSCAIQDEDFDLEYPLECDDEYWEDPDPEKRFKQPINKPSLITAFVLYIRLNQILAFSLRTIYALNRSKVLLGFVGRQWEQHIVAELDSALNKWVDTVPDYLRWDPHREDFNFFNQSVVLYTSYYQLQILIHRPFIPSPSKPSPFSFPSLTICTNAGRSCCHIIDTQRRQQPYPPPQTLMAAFTAGVVLLLNIWCGKRAGLFADTSKEMADVIKCMDVMRAFEGSWNSAGRLWDVLYELASVGDLSLSEADSPDGAKREHETEAPESTAASTSNARIAEGSRNIAGPRRVLSPKGITLSSAFLTQSQPPHSQVPNTQSLPANPARARQAPTSESVRNFPLQVPTENREAQQQMFALPVYSDELRSPPLRDAARLAPPAQQRLEGTPSNYWLPPTLDADYINNAVPARDTNQNSTRFPPVSAPPYREQQASIRDHSIVLEQQPMGHASNVPASPTPVPAVLQARASDGHLGMAGNHPTHFSTVQAQHLPPPQLHSDQPQQFQAQSNQHHFIDSDAMAVWSNAPWGFELDDWNAYLSNVGQLMQGHQVMHPEYRDTDGL